MKLSELATRAPKPFLSAEDDIRNRLLRDCTYSGNIDIVNGVINMPRRQGGSKPNIMNIKDASITGGRLKFKFGVVDGVFDAPNCTKLTSLEGFPVSAYSLTLPDTYDGPLDHVTRKVVGIAIMRGLTTLVGIHDHFDYIKSIACKFSRIKSGGMGLLLIKGLDTESYSVESVPEPFKIINKYLGRPDDIFECQAELIENGFEEFAQL